MISPKIHFSVYPYNLPNTAPRTNVGVKTPAGIGRLILKVVNINFRKVNKARFNIILGSFQCAFSSDFNESCENISCRICLSGKRRKSFGKDVTAAIKPTDNQIIHLFDKYGTFFRILRESSFLVRIMKKDPRNPDIIPKRA